MVVYHPTEGKGLSPSPQDHSHLEATAQTHLGAGSTYFFKVAFSAHVMNKLEYCVRCVPCTDGTVSSAAVLLL